jgi:hypothetical protein
MTKYRGYRSSITRHACLVCPQTYKVFLRSARLTHVLYRYEKLETFRPDASNHRSSLSLAK